MPDWLTNNLFWKFLSLVLSATLWLTFVGEQEVSTMITAPVHFRNLPKDLETSSDFPQNLRLEIRGPAGKLTQRNLEEVAVSLDLLVVSRPGQRTFTITRDNVDLPAGAIFSRAIPAQIRLEFDRSMEKEVLVDALLSNGPPEGYEIVRREAFPPRLRIVGPAGRVESIASVQTDPIDVSSVVARREFQVHAYSVDPYVRFVKSPDVAVIVEVARRTGKPKIE
jgi:hypothetical protein